MKVLIVGSGAREHAIAWKLMQSELAPRLYITPGNDGMANLAACLPYGVEEGENISRFAVQNEIDLVVIGPEAALAAGVGDALMAGGVKVFGPSRAAAQIETSKAFAKNFMQQHGIPTARYAVFNDLGAALTHIETVDYPLVIKASGLAAGKGVILPETGAEARQALTEMLADKKGNEVVIEERLRGQEISLLAFSDGKNLALLPAARDHKRQLDGDQGPNTGGMGAFAPAMEISAQEADAFIKTIFQPVIDGLAAMGSPYVGVLYAGLMLTESGPKVLEYNARFGDPETQVLLPLLENDLLEVLLACTQQRLDQIQITWRSGAAHCVVLASAGYPQSAQTGYEIRGLGEAANNSVVFHAATRKQGDVWLNAGGRVLTVASWDQDLKTAREKTYALVEKINFNGVQYRRDIGMGEMNPTGKSAAYRSAGVDIDAGNRAVQLMKADVQSTFTPQVLSHVGSYGGLFDISNLGAESVLVASTDGVGTKVELAARLDRVQGVGQDIVNHCVNDILVQGAKPLFFLDYFASSQLKPEMVAGVVSGMAAACRENGCALLGGETAEMPGVYREGTFDVAGTIGGVVQAGAILPRKAEMRVGDLLLGFRSSGPHTNGYSLIRKLIEGEDLLEPRTELGGSLADLLLAPHRSYLRLLYSQLSKFKALAHITGGGFIENIPRVLPDHLQATIELNSWQVPELYDWLMQKGAIEKTEMYRVFNMGIGMIAVIDPQDLNALRNHITEDFYIIGRLEERRSRAVELIG